MLAIFFDLTSFFDLQEWVPMGDLKKKKKKRRRRRRKSAFTWDRDIKEHDCMKKKKKKKRYSIVWSSSTIKKYLISVISNTTLFF